MTLRSKLIGLVALAGLSACGAPPADVDSDDFEWIRGVVEPRVHRLMAEYDVPGMAVAVTVRGRSHFFHYGVASKGSDTAVDAETLFEIGSVSKTFTATLAAYAEALGKLSWDDRPGRHLPELAGTAIDEADLLHLGTYTAGGLPLQFPEDVADEEGMIRYFREWRPDAAPGTQRRYSNPSIGLFGRIAAVSLESDFATALEDRLLPELGLRGSYIRVPEHAMARYAWGTDEANEATRVKPGVLDAEAYGLKSTSSDLIRFVQANIDPSRLPEPVRRAVEETHVGYFRVGEMVQGLGWEQYPYPIPLERLLAGNSRAMLLQSNAAIPLTPPQRPSGPTLFNKTGSTGGFGAYVAFVPEEGIGIVMLANRNYPIPARIEAAHGILEHLARRAE